MHKSFKLYLFHWFLLCKQTMKNIKTNKIKMLEIEVQKQEVSSTRQRMVAGTNNNIAPPYIFHVFVI